QSANQPFSMVRMPSPGSVALRSSGTRFLARTCTSSMNITHGGTSMEASLVSSGSGLTIFKDFGPLSNGMTVRSNFKEIAMYRSLESRTLLGWISMNGSITVSPNSRDKVVLPAEVGPKRAKDWSEQQWSVRLQAA